MRAIAIALLLAGCGDPWCETHWRDLRAGDRKSTRILKWDACRMVDQSIRQSCYNDWDYNRHKEQRPESELIWQEEELEEYKKFQWRIENR